MNLLAAMNFLLEQTQQEKKLTVLYVSLFVIVMGMLVIDALAMQKWTPKPVHILLMVILAVALVALILLISTSYAK